MKLFEYQKISQKYFFRAFYLINTQKNLNQEHCITHCDSLCLIISRFLIFTLISRKFLKQVDLFGKRAEII